MSPRSDDLGQFFVHLFEGLSGRILSFPPVFLFLPRNARDLFLTVPLLNIDK
jgi:hypothetical protein